MQSDTTYTDAVEVEGEILTVEKVYENLSSNYVVVNELKLDHLLASARSAGNLAQEAFNELTNAIELLQELALQLHRVDPVASKLLMDQLVVLDDAWHDLDQSLSWDDVVDLEMIPNTTALQAAEVAEIHRALNFGEPDDGSGYNPKAERPLSVREQIAAQDAAVVPAPEDRLPLVDDEEEDPHAEANNQLAKFGMAMQVGLGLDDLLVDERDEYSDDEWAEQQLLLIPQNLDRPDLAQARLELIDYLTKREMAAVLKERMRDMTLSTHQRGYLSEERIRLLKEAAEDEARDIPAPTSAAEIQLRRNKEYVDGFDFSAEDPTDFTFGPPTEDAVKRSRNKVEEDRRKFAQAAVEYGYPAGSSPFEPTEPEARTPHPEHPGLNPEMARVHRGVDNLTGNEIYYAISLGVMDSPSHQVKVTISEGNVAYAHRDEFRHVPMGDLILRLWQQPVSDQEIDERTLTGLQPRSLPKTALVHRGVMEATGETVWYCPEINGVINTTEDTFLDDWYAAGQREQGKNVPSMSVFTDKHDISILTDIEFITLLDHLQVPSSSKVEVVYKAKSNLAREDVEVGPDGRSVLKDEYCIYTLLEPIGSDKARRYYFRTTHPVPDPNLSNENHRLLAPVEITSVSEELVVEAAKNRELGRPFIVSGERLAELLGTKTAGVTVHVEAPVSPSDAIVAEEGHMDHGGLDTQPTDKVDRPVVGSDDDEMDDIARYYYGLYFGEFDDASDDTNMFETVLDAYQQTRTPNPEGEHDPFVWDVGDTVVVTGAFKFYKGKEGEVVEAYRRDDGKNYYTVRFHNEVPVTGGNPPAEGHYDEDELQLIWAATEHRGDDIDAYFGAFTDVNKPEYYEPMPHAPYEDEQAEAEFALAYESPHFHEQHGEPAPFLESHEQDMDDEYAFGYYAPI